MLIRQDVLRRIESGEVDLAFRRWTRPTVKPGGHLRTRIGELAIDSVTRVPVASITAAEARRAGHSSLAELRRMLAVKNAMTAPLEINDCEQGEHVAAYTVRALPEEGARSLEQHFGSCWQCRREVEALLPVVDAFVAWLENALIPDEPA